jgi:hypothetical protein
MAAPARQPSSLARDAPRGSERPVAAAEASLDTADSDIESLQLDEFSVSQFRQLFELLDRWDRQVDKAV